jgi:hypothetical protein
MNLKLFDVPTEKHNECRTCMHRERHQCGGTIIQYCGILKSNRTQNGKLKIKCKTKACVHYDTEIN